MINLKKSKEIVEFLNKPVKESKNNWKVRRNSYYLSCVRYSNIKKKSILLESYHGVNFTGNPYALFKKIVEAYPEYKCYIAIQNINDPMIKWLLEKYKNKNFEIIEYESKQYLKLLATCKYLVNDTSFMPYFIKRKEQTYLNTWHGTPLKTLGTDIHNASFNTHKNIQKNLFSTDKLSMPNKFTADKLIYSHDLNGILNAEVDILGNPRVDLTLNSKDEEIRKKYDLIKNKKIVLFAPTWKKSESATTKQDLENLISETKIIQNILGNNYHVYLKTHYFIYKKMTEMSFKNHLIPNWVDTNELLASVHSLITDYSSIFFDFLPLKRPIYFYMPDKELYEQKRGLYLDTETLPGKVSSNLNELLSHLSEDESKYLKSYQKNINDYLNNYCKDDNGISSPQVIDFMLGKRKADKKYKSNKKVVVFYGGGFYNNGITNSIINLSKNFNYDKYEFVIIETEKKFQAKVNNINRLDKRVHLITKFSYTNRTIWDTLNQNLLYRQGLESKYLSKRTIENFFKLDFQKVFGKIDPDIMIDYGGYNKMFTALFAFAPVKKKGIFLHNDAIGEYNKIINGRYKHRWDLKVIFSLYDKFDKIVSVTESLNEVNKKGLNNLITNKNEKMISISNVIDGQNIIEMAKEAEDDTNHLNFYNLDNELEEYLLYKKQKTSKCYITVKGIEAPSVKNNNFVNVARLSPEKNHEELIIAFKEIVNIDSKSKLYILGDGPLFKPLNKLISSLGLENNVFLLGFMDNPFMFVSQCDCFILTSNYEGQGMVILEAQTLGKPVIGTNVVGINSVLNNNNGLLVEKSVKGITNGMKEYLNGNVPVINFDYETYNKHIIEKLEKEILEN